MKKVLALLLLIMLCVSAFSQNKQNLPPTSTIDVSVITKSDKLVESFKIKNKRYSVYCGYQQLNDNLRQEIGDTLEVYKIVAEKRRSSEMEITKYATRNGKIIRKSFYKIESDTLTVISEAYDYIGAFRMTDRYITDKYGLKKISDTMEGVNTKNLSDKYQKPAVMRPPVPAKN